jgi:hypothetical protein
VEDSLSTARKLAATSAIAAVLALAVTTTSSANADYRGTGAGSTSSLATGQANPGNIRMDYGPDNIRMD